MSSQAKRCGRATIPPLATVYAIGVLVCAVLFLNYDQIGEITQDDGPIQIANVSLLLGLCGLAAFRTWANPGDSALISD